MRSFFFLVIVLILNTTGKLYATVCTNLAADLLNGFRCVLQPNSFYEDQIKNLQANISQLTETNSKLQVELIQAQKATETLRNELLREREISSKLMSEKALIDRLLRNACDLKCQKENLTCLLLENTQLKANVSILNEKCAHLQNELTRANQGKTKAQFFHDMIANQHKFHNQQQQEQQHVNQTHVKRYEGMILSGEDDCVQMYSLETGRRINKFHGVSGGTTIELVSDDLLITNSPDFSIIVWNLRRDKRKSSLVGHTSSVISFALLSDDKLASGSTNAEVRIWNIESGKCLRTLVHSRGVSYAWAVLALQALPNRRLASSSECGDVRIWNLDTGECMKSLNNNPSESHIFYYCTKQTKVYALASLPNNRLASGREDFTIQIWDLVNYSCLKTLRGHSGAVYALLALPSNSNVLVSASADKTVRKWTLDALTSEATQITTLSGHSDQVFSLALVSASKIASASFDNTIRLWDTESGRCTQTIQNATFIYRSSPEYFSTSCIRFTPLTMHVYF